MARYELILRFDGALWLRIIFKPLLILKWPIKIQKMTPKRGAPAVEEAVVQMCAWGPFTVYIYILVRPRAYPCTL